MSAPARLLALRLQGFKSFAERTVVEFGPGISAVVGPNGSGKSNLADALRWALGEQGRALRSRRSEDVIFAGSERRSALGMADVALVFDNADRLLPVDFGTVELGRRLYRSGENDYLLNRQRIRLRDLVDLLDSAHLSDNAFLFIGQGMVDQALALRPEERRPLFEEVAGVRRHDRRRRRAEEQLVEAEANLARVEDILAELRPQARRLAIQAEQQASRQTAGREFGRAVLVSGHARWHEASLRATESADRHRRGRGEADRAMAELREAEEVAGSIGRDLGSRSRLEAERRSVHEAARAALTELQVRQARLASALEGVGRDRRRLAAERAAAEADRASQRRVLALPVPGRPLDLEAALSQADRALGEAEEELRILRTARQARGEALAALRRAEAARHAERQAAERALAEGSRRLQEEAATAAEVAGRHAEQEGRLGEARGAAETAREDERRAAAAREQARTRRDELDLARHAATERASSTSARQAALRARHDGLAARLAEEEARGIARAARRRGGRLVDEGLEVAPDLRAAVEAVLGDGVRAYLVSRDAVPELGGERGVLVVEQVATAAVQDHGGSVAERARGLGGGPLAEAVRRDPTGVVRRLLSRAVWVPDLAAALELQPLLPPGWVGVTRDGAVVAGTGTVALGKAESRLERRAELAQLASQLERLETEARVDAEAASTAGEAARVAAAEVESARIAEAGAAAVRRQAEVEEQRIGRDVEAAAREAAWHRAQVERLTAERDRLAAAAAALTRTEEPARGRADGQGEPPALDKQPGHAPDRNPDPDEVDAQRQWEGRVAELRERRDRLVAELGERDRVRRISEERQARASAALALDDERIDRADRESSDLDERDRALGLELEELSAALATAAGREADARGALDSLRAADTLDRERLAAAEAAASAARGRLRSADDRLRAAELAEMEARLALETIREQVTVELAGLGELGSRLVADALEESPTEAAFDLPPALAPADGLADSSHTADPADGTDGFEAALEQLTQRWAAEPPAAEPPTPARLGSLRRRFHDVGAANPFAVEEYAAVKARLEASETQRADLTAAIARTRALIEELGAMINEQFKATFRALETAFDARFRQLFGGGFARLSLTDPEDLATTGVEIVARPPGKKPQALAMLSGGERALTAVALLFSMLHVRPVPFCVLDEVDAALDEANVGRFVEALRELAAETQCIVITHNRGTIEAADALYGVTIRDDAVSRVISLRLEEAQAIAESIQPATAFAPSA